MAAFSIDQEVRILSANRYHPSPDGGWVGKVTKRGRRYATATYTKEVSNWRGELETYERVIEFDMDTGIERGGTRYNSDRVCTPEQLEQEARHDVAMATLKDAGLEMRTGRTLSLGLAEAVAAVIETFGQGGTE